MDRMLLTEPIKRPAGAPQFAVSVLGPMRVTAGGRDVELRHRKARALMAYLALTEGGQETRERLVGLLWSESEESKARSSLRQTLYELSRSLEAAGFSGLNRSQLRVSLDPTKLEVDARELLKLAQAGQIHPRLIDEPLIPDSYLRDLDDLDPSFAVWAKARRQGFHDHLVQSLEATLRSQSHRSETRRECARAILNLDPTHEEACRVFMRLSAEAGDPSAALRAYKALWDLLEEEYDAEPSPETVGLVTEIKQGLIEPSPPAQKTTEVLPPSATQDQSLQPTIKTAARLALLLEPFGVNGVDPENVLLVEGFRHELIACLIRFREWFVVSGSSLSAEQKADSRVSAAYCVAATAYRAGDAMSLIVTLRELESGIHVWSDRFAVTLADWFETQQQIVRQIAISLSVQVSMGRLSRIASEPVVSLPVYDLWLRGQAALNRFSAENWDTAARVFTAAIQRAPDFAPGYSSLAQMSNVSHFVYPGVRRSPEKEQKTLDLAYKAVALDPMDSRSQLALGWSLAMAKDYQQAALHMELARELNPSDSWTLISSALCLAYCGNVALAAKQSAQSIRLTLAPTRLHWAYQVQIAFLQRDYTAAIHAADRSQDVMLGMIAWRAAALAHLGETLQAKKEATRFLNLVRSSWAGDEPPTEEAIGRWLLQMFPISDADAWERLRYGVAAAGIPDGGARHHGW